MRKNKIRKEENVGSSATTPMSLPRFVQVVPVGGDWLAARVREMSNRYCLELETSLESLYHVLLGDVEGSLRMM